MKCTKLLSVVLIVFIFCLSVNAKKSYHGDQLWRVVPTTSKQVEYLKNLQNSPDFQLDAWTEVRTVNKYGLYHVSKQHLNTLRDDMKKHEIEPIVTIQNLQTVIERQAPSSKSATTKATSIEDFDYSVYHTAEEIYQWINFAANEANVQKFQIGITYEGRKMYALKIGETDGSRPVVYVDALTHCPEWIAAATTIFAFKEIITNPAYGWMKNNVDWIFIPMINIDGYIYTHTDDRLWRKTRSQSAAKECFGVDLNRNWDDYWTVRGSSYSSCHRNFHGAKPESEPEVRHLARYIAANKDMITAVISVHSFTQHILYPYHWPLINATDRVELQALGDVMAEAIRQTHGMNFTVIPGTEFEFLWSGATTDWTYRHANITLSYSFELRDLGEHGLLLPPDQIIPSGEEFLAAMVKLAKYVIDSFSSGSGSGMENA